MNAAAGGPGAAPAQPLRYRIAQRVAFELGAGIYEFITDQEAWRRDCRDMAPLVPGPRILDLGVGPGTSALEMASRSPGALFFGFDLSHPMLRRARAHALSLEVKLPLVRGDALRLPFRSGVFDGVTGHSLLYLLPDAGAALAEARRVLRPGGRVAFLEPREGRARFLPAFAERMKTGTAIVLWRAMARLHRRYSEASLSALLARCGFGEVRARPVLFGHGVVVEGVRP